MHRRDFKKASQQAADALSKASALTPTVEMYPTLRPGAYTALLEEYAEAVLFLAFAQAQKVATLEEVLVDLQCTLFHECIRAVVAGCIRRALNGKT